MFRNSNPSANDENRDPPQSIPYNSSREVSNLKLRATESGNKRNEEEENQISRTSKTQIPFEVSSVSHRQNVYSEDEDVTKVRFGENKESDNHLGTYALKQDLSLHSKYHSNVENYPNKNKFLHLKIDKIINEFQITTVKKPENDPPLSEERGCCKKGACAIF